ncbi:MAG TPA: SRPBCC family protein, partial [Phycisphaerae bacterium]|nr:SRPBCC family protein [Phycisphaerae bacterium]
MTTRSAPAGNQTSVVRVSRFIRAPRERVFDAWLSTEMRRKWWYTGRPEGLHDCEIDARAGGRYVMKQIGSPEEMEGVDPNFEWVMEGEFVEILRPQRIVFTWKVNHDPPVVNTRVTLEFREVRGGTELTLTHEGLATPEMREGTRQGWAQM